MKLLVDHMKPTHTLNITKHLHYVYKCKMANQTIWKMYLY